MDIHTIGSIIKQERTACGLSQRTLAEAAHISRVTLVNLENGKVGDIGAVKLAHIAEHVGLTLFSSKQTPDFLNRLVNNMNTSYKTSMTLAALENLLLHGEIKPGHEGQVLHMLDESPTPLIIGAVKQLASQYKVSAKSIWKKLAHIAVHYQSPRTFWGHFG